MHQNRMDPSGYNELLPADKMEPVTGSDQACLEELRDVLNKHGKIERFGLAILHKHFDLNDGEVLVEETDLENRTLIISPKKIKDIPEKGMVQTIFSLKTGESMLGCVVVCAPKSDGTHPVTHRKTL